MDTLFLPRQVKYAGLDAYAGVLLARYMMDRMDPVLHVDPPDSTDLPKGTAVRLYAKTGIRCVGEGTVADPPTGRTWGSTSFAVGKQRATDRVVVKLTRVFVPGALALYRSQDGHTEKSLDALGVDAEVLWDTVDQTLRPGMPS